MSQDIPPPDRQETDRCEVPTPSARFGRKRDRMVEDGIPSLGHRYPMLVPRGCRRWTT